MLVAGRSGSWQCVCGQERSKSKAVAQHELRSARRYFCWEPLTGAAGVALNSATEARRYSTEKVDCGLWIVDCWLVDWHFRQGKIITPSRGEQLLLFFSCEPLTASRTTSQANCTLPMPPHTGHISSNKNKSIVPTPRHLPHKNPPIAGSPGRSTLRLSIALRGMEVIRFT